MADDGGSELAAPRSPTSQPPAVGRLPVAVRVACLAAAIAGLGLRIWVLHSPLGHADSDEAVVGLMARHLLHFHASPFFWGQTYGGIQEQGLVAVLFLFFGSSAFVMKLVAISLDAAAAWLVWRVGRRLLGEPAAIIAGVMFWTAPFAYVYLSTKEYGFYGVAQISCLVVVLSALRLSETVTWHDAGWLGFGAGFGWYATPQAGYIILPCLVWLLVRSRELRVEFLRVWWAAAAGAVVGGLPWLVANVHSGFFSLRLPGVPVHTTYYHRLSLVFSTGLPVLLGLKVPSSGGWLVRYTALPIYVAVLAAFVAAVLLRRIPPHTGLLLYIILAYPFLVALPTTSYNEIDGRYLYLLLPAVTLLLAAWFVRNGSITMPIGSLAVVTALSVAGCASLIWWSPSHRNHYSVVADQNGPLIKALNEQGVRFAFADYWIAYRIDLASAERITATPLTSVRYIPFDKRVRASQRPAYLLWRGTSSDQTMGAALARLGVEYQRLVVGLYAVYLPSTRVLPEQVPGVT